MDKYFQDEFKVNMGSSNNKKQLTKEQLLAQNKKERIQREIIRNQSNAATMVQKYLRSYKSNQDLTKSILGDPALKLRDTMIGLHAATVKVPAQRDAIFVKGFEKFQKYLVTGLNSFLLTLGSCDSDIKS